MPESERCPQCDAEIGADSPGGLCPRCLADVGIGLTSSSNGDPPSATPLSASQSMVDYQLQEEIGHGGMGMVYRARQMSLGREVAFKLIKPGMDSSQVLARFEAERQTLARMDHPNIARVIDAGTIDAGLSTLNPQLSTSLGRPYFVMELVEGIPITHYCDEHRVSSRERLDLFMSVCHAIQHAHQKGIIHRDIKPSNVLVTVQDGKPVPKVIDFGIAKAAGPRLTEESFATEIGALIGTLEYMSPEQAGLDPGDIDTRSDIYALGILLYELLTGTTPLNRKTLKKLAFDELLRLVREQEPPKPSTRLAEQLASSAAASIPNSKLETRNSKLPSDLDWIVMKALEKNRARRYETSTAFAQDVHRFLNEEPVVARPPSTTYRSLKFMRRHRAVVTIAAAFIVSLIMATVVSTAFALWDQAEKRKAKNSENEARTVLQFFRDKVLAAVRPKTQRDGLGWNVTLREAIDSAAPGIEHAFTNHPLIEASIRDVLGNSYVVLGFYTNGIAQHERALALRRLHLGVQEGDTLSSMNNLAMAYAFAGRKSNALSLSEAALKLRKPSFEPHHIDTLTAMNNLANSYQSAKRTNEALAIYEQVLGLRKATLGPNHPDTLMSMHNLATCYQNFGWFNEALALGEATLELSKANLGPRDPNTLRCMNNLANTYRRARQFTNAFRLHEETLNLRKATLGPDHPDTLRSMKNLALAHEDAGRWDPALPLYEEVLEMRKAKLGPEHPDTLRSIYDLGLGYRQLNRYADAETVLTELLAMQRRLLPGEMATLAATLDPLGTCVLRQGKAMEAEELLRELVTIQEKLLPDDWALFKAKGRLGQAFLAQRVFAKAEMPLIESYQGLKQRETNILPNVRGRYLEEAVKALVLLYTSWGKPAQAEEWRKKLAEFAPPPPAEPAPRDPK